MMLASVLCLTGPWGEARRRLSFDLFQRLSLGSAVPEEAEAGIRCSTDSRSRIETI